jgi:ABC-2 type transport system ATP-binding protein
MYGLYPYAPAYRLMPAAYRRQVEELAHMLGLEKEIFSPIRSFSGGMARKLEIVRSLIHRPQVLFLDEPTAGLDAPSRRTLWDYLTTIRREHGTTVFLTTHYLEEAEQADCICIMDHGRVVANGTPAQLKADLAREMLIVDAPDRVRLRAELARLGLTALGDGPFEIALEGSKRHAVLRSIDTPLTVVETRSPSLEDAYMEIVGRPDA